MMILIFLVAMFFAVSANAGTITGSVRAEGKSAADYLIGRICYVGIET